MKFLYFIFAWLDLVLRRRCPPLQQSVFWTVFLQVVLSLACWVASWRVIFLADLTVFSYIAHPFLPWSTSGTVAICVPMKEYTRESVIFHSNYMAEVRYSWQRIMSCGWHHLHSSDTAVVVSVTIYSRRTTLSQFRQYELPSSYSVFNTSYFMWCRTCFVC